MDEEVIKSNVLSPKHWLRMVFMLLFGFVVNIALFVMWAVAVLQFVFSLISGKDNDKLRALGSSLSTYFNQIFRFITYNTEDKPFPFADWPEPEIIDSADADDATETAEIVETPVAEAKSEADAEPAADKASDDAGEEPVKKDA